MRSTTRVGQHRERCGDCSFPKLAAQKRQPIICALVIHNAARRDRRLAHHNRRFLSMVDAAAKVTVHLCRVFSSSSRRLKPLDGSHRVEVSRVLGEHVVQRQGSRRTTASRNDNFRRARIISTPSTMAISDVAEARAIRARLVCCKPTTAAATRPSPQCRGDAVARLWSKRRPPRPIV